MLSFAEALEEDQYPAVCDGLGIHDNDLSDGWDVEFFPETELRPELRLFNGRAADLEISCRSGRRILSHKEVLQEVPAFATLLKQNDAVSVDEDVQILFEVVRWIYCKDAFADKDTVLDVLRLAERFDVTGLADHCGRLLVAFGMVEVEGGNPMANLAAKRAAGAEELGDEAAPTAAEGAENTSSLEDATAARPAEGLGGSADQATAGDEPVANTEPSVAGPGYPGGMRQGPVLTKSKND
eukprot:TRINITY_DN14836_c0_g1_i1.p1 TRINITY_DN14836_c0_g1~~TRINITY_DN14836_c0_g1_i1.p1  ORF type:complete len:240 (-),score=55.83 TRINITY_DN14836_c0_g1_i1:85-804(-)